MKNKNILKFLFVCVIMLFIQGCNNWQYYISQNSYGRKQLKDMKLKKSFDSSKIDLVDLNAIYYHHDVDESINMEFNFIIRFFKNGQYAFFSRSDKPIVNLTYKDVDFNDLNKASEVGYYNVKNKTVKVEFPNHPLVGSLKKYRVLPNGDMELRIASNYKHIYKKILVENLKDVKPDW